VSILIKNKNGSTPISFAIQQGQTEVVQWLRDNGAKDDDAPMGMFLATKEGTVENVRYFIEKEGIGVDVEDEDNWTVIAKIKSDTCRKNRYTFETRSTE